MTTPVFELRSASKCFGRGREGRRIIGPIDAEIHAGEIVGVIGPNGAGKSTLLRLLAGEIRPDRGSVRVLGRPAAHREARAVVGFAPDPPVVGPSLSGAMWLRYFAAHRTVSAPDCERRSRWAHDLAGGAGEVGRASRALSRGGVQRLGLAAAVVAGTRAVVLDETLSGIDAPTVRSLQWRLVSLAGGGRAVVIASHALASLERFATRVLMLDDGRVRADRAVADVIAGRIAEIVVAPGAARAATRVRGRLPRARLAGDRLLVPLARGASLEEVLAVCRAERLPVAGSRVRHVGLEDLVLASLGSGPAIA